MKIGKTNLKSGRCLGHPWILSCVQITGAALVWEKLLSFILPHEYLKFSEKQACPALC